MKLYHSFYHNNKHIGNVEMDYPLPLNKGEIITLCINNNTGCIINCYLEYQHTISKSNIQFKVKRKYWYHDTDVKNNVHLKFHLKKYTPLLERIKKFIFN